MNGLKTLVLVAERDAAILDLYRLYLEGSGYEVVTAIDGLDCCSKMIDRRPDVLVLECGLLWGGADGVIARTRDDFELSSVPVVLIDRENGPEELAKLFAESVVACLQKPFHMSDLLLHLTSVEQQVPVAKWSYS